MKNFFPVIYLVTGLVVVYILKGTTTLFNFSFGWSGMSYLDQTGFPFAWKTVCPAVPHSPGTFPLPTGCVDGFNLAAFILNIIIFTLIAMLIKKFLIDKIIKR